MLPKMSRQNSGWATHHESLPMQFDLTLTLSIIVATVMSAVGSFVVIRVRLALTERRSGEAFDIAKENRDKLAEYKLEAAKGFASVQLLEKTESRLTDEISKVVVEVKGLRADLIAALKPSHRKPEP